jgi:hypothetical protein
VPRKETNIPANPTFRKREKERARHDKQQKKEAKRQERRRDRPNRGPGLDGVDPDIAGIIPGPQPDPPE